jgi:hypothetical protein
LPDRERNRLFADPAAGYATGNGLFFHLHPYPNAPEPGDAKTDTDALADGN